MCILQKIGPLASYLLSIIVCLLVVVHVRTCIVGGALPRQKRRAGNQSASKEAQAVYHKMTEVLENIALLVETQPLTDTILLMVGAAICNYRIAEIFQGIQYSWIFTISRG